MYSEFLINSTLSQHAGFVHFRENSTFVILLLANVSIFTITNLLFTIAVVGYRLQLLFEHVVDVRDALVGVGLILKENGNFSFDKGLLM